MPSIDMAGRRGVRAVLIAMVERAYELDALADVLS